MIEGRRERPGACEFRLHRKYNIATLVGNPCDCGVSVAKRSVNLLPATSLE